LSRTNAHALVYALCSLLPAAALAGDVFDVLAPERIGAKLDSVLQDGRLDCRQDPNDAGGRLCEALPGNFDTLHDLPLGTVLVTLHDERLEQVTIHFAESHFARVKALLAARLGKGEDASFTVRAGMAGTFTNEVIVWETSGWVAIARQYDGKIDRSSLIYGTPDALSALLKRTRSKPPGARDL
jgi:hypothetical protein